MPDGSIDLGALSPGQTKALEAVLEWVNDPNSDQVFRLFGYAGTGKTTIAKLLVQQTRHRAAYMAFTGKAALVMSRNGCTDATTIHSAIYEAVQNEQTGEVTFELNTETSPIKSAGIVVVDEVSMVDEKLGQDLESFGKRILVLGDPAQLPPVKGSGYFTDAEPDAMLTEIHRQALNNPILRAATAAREGRKLVHGSWGGRLTIVPRGKLTTSDYLEADQVIVGRNLTRSELNGRMRRAKGAPDWMPRVGDRLVCLKNNREKALFNGGIFSVVEGERRGSWLSLLVQSEDFANRDPQRVAVRVEFFEGGLDDLDWRTKKDSDQFDYGYALTCHKSQGSQWPNVILCDESQSFREEAARWLYTGITRASERLTIIQGG